MTDRRLINDVVSPQTHPLPEPLIRKVTWIGVSVNVALAVFKLAAGIYGDSRAVIADGIEALLDVFTVLSVYAGSRFWSRPPDYSHPLGHGRMETLMVVVIGERRRGWRSGSDRSRSPPCTNGTRRHRAGSPPSRPWRRSSARKSSTAGRSRSAAGSKASR